MLVYILKRVFAMIPTLLGITLITFLIINGAPGDPVALQMSGGGGGGGGAEGGGGSSAESQARRADAIRAKNRLLGMMEPEHVVRAWDVGGVGTAAPGPSGGVPARRVAAVGAWNFWPRAMVVDRRAGRMWVGLQDGTIHRVDLATGEESPGFTAERFEKSDAGKAVEGAAIWRLALSPDGARLAASDGTGRIRVLDAGTGRTLADPKPLGRTVRDLAFLPDGATIASACDDGRIRLHDTATLAVRKELVGHSLHVGAIAISPDGTRLYSVGYDRKVRRWDLATGVATSLGEVSASGNAMALTADGTRLAVGGDDRGARVFDVAAGTAPATVLLRFDGSHPRPVTAIAFTPDGTSLVTAAKDGSFRIWRTSDGTEAAHAPDSTNGEIFVVIPSPDGKTLWTASECDRKTPIWKRYLTWLGKTVRLDFDRSFIDNELVLDKLKAALPVTLGLNVLAILITYMIAVPVGVAMARRRGGRFDQVSSVVVFLLWSLPNFWFATLLIQWFSSKNHFDLFASVDIKSLHNAQLAYVPAMLDRMNHLVLPIVVLTYAGFAGLSQYMRTSMLETISQDYVRTARAKGLAESMVIYKHALRNSLVTMVTLVGTMLPALVGGSVIVERIFSIQGMGNMGFEAIQQRDYPVIMAVTTLSATLTLAGMLVSDVLYAVVDPRISHK